MMPCRICLEDAPPETMLTPCKCLGTSAYIHSECLRSYVVYYPDRICRVCRSEMEGPPEPLLTVLMFSLLGMSITYSAVPLMTKLGLSLTLMGMTIYYAKRKLFNDTVAAFLMAMYLTFATGGHPDAVFIFLLSLYTLSLALSIFLTKQLALFLLVGPAVFAMTIYIMVPFDGFATAVYLSLLFLGWYAWIRTAVRV